jgi:hypothetical protein
MQDDNSTRTSISYHRMALSCDDDRLFCNAKSGFANVKLVANKLAPETFACSI